MADDQETLVVLDTNVYMHAQPFDEVDWHIIVGADAVTIILPAQVLRELDKHKDQHQSRIMRERVRGVIARLKPLLGSGNNGRVRDGVSVEFYRPRLTAEQFAGWGLDPDIPDERVIAAATALRVDRPGARVLLVARDSTPQILGAQLGLQVLELPGHLERKPEPDPLERKLQQLQQDNAKLVDARPRLSLSFFGGDTKIEITLPDPTVDPTDKEIQRRLSEAAWEYPSINDLAARRARLRRMGRNVPSIGSVFDAGEVERYNTERAQHQANLVKYFESFRLFRARAQRRFQLELTLSNDGTVPANDITVALALPPGCDVETESTAVGPPGEPPQPREPGAGRSRGSYDPANYNAFWTEPNGPPAIGDPEITEDESGASGDRVVFRERKVQQATLTVLPPLFVAIGSDDGVKPFNFSYELRADNMQPIAGVLHVIVRFESQRKKRRQNERTSDGN